ncbi:MAG: hypothetical protein R3B90_20480 [Planctomycetaceae bacterium]
MLRAAWSAMAMVAVLAMCATSQADEEMGFRPIFDGKTLTGWKAWSGDEVLAGRRRGDCRRINR